VSGVPEPSGTAFEGQQFPIFLSDYLQAFCSGILGNFVECQIVTITASGLLEFISAEKPRAFPSNRANGARLHSGSSGIARLAADI
jgi:hypothetical protein